MTTEIVTIELPVPLDSEQQEVAMISFPVLKGEDDIAWRKRAFEAYAKNLVKMTAEGTIARSGILRNL